MTEAEFLSLDPEDRDGLIDEAVWGLDRTANTDQRRAMALRGMFTVWAIREEYAEGAIGFAAKREDLEGCWAWDHRIGKPWQAVMEKYVAAWREAPSQPWTQNVSAAWEVLGLLSVQESDVRWSIAGELAKTGVVICFRDDQGQGWHTFAAECEGVNMAATAICLAALKAKGAIS